MPEIDPNELRRAIERRLHENHISTAEWGVGMAIHIAVSEAVAMSASEPRPDPVARFFALPLWEQATIHQAMRDGIIIASLTYLRRRLRGSIADAREVARWLEGRDVAMHVPSDRASAFILGANEHDRRCRALESIANGVLAERAWNAAHPEEHHD